MGCKCQCANCSELPSGVWQNDPALNDPFGGQFTSPPTATRAPYAWGPGTGPDQTANNLNQQGSYTSGAFAPLQLGKVLPRLFGVVDVWNPYLLPSAAFGNPDLRRGPVYDVQDTQRPAQEYPRYRYSALDVEEIRREARRRVEATMRGRGR